MIYIYRPVYFLLKLLLLTLKPFVGNSLKQWIKLRQKPFEIQHDFKATYWFHASSGEIEYCKSVIRLLKEQHPHSQIVVTYSSPSAEKLFHNISQFVDQFIPLSWDQPGQIKRLINYIQPQIVIFSRTDLWPELLQQIKKRRIKVGVISYNPRFSFLNNMFTRPMLDKMNFISCLNEKTKNRLFLVTENRHITADGDTRFDQVFYRLSQEPKLKIHSYAKILVCGSTWPEDEEVLLEILPELFKRNIKIVLSPHEVGAENIRRLLSELKQRNFSYQTLSSEVDPQKISLEKDLLIIDKIGYLADSYRFADFAFVGGSYKEKVHSVMEPLCCGLPVAVGPHYRNNPEAVRYQGKFVFPSENTAELLQNIEKSRELDRSDILTEMQRNRKASEKVLRLISNTLLKISSF